MLATLGLVLVFAAGWIEIWHIYVIMFVRGLGGAFHFPAMQASTSLMVPPKQLARIAGMNQTLQGAVSIIAPPLGAVLIEVMSTQNVLLIDVVTALVAILPLFFIPIPQPIRKNGNGGKETQLWQDMKEGFAFVKGWPGLLAIIGMAAMINFLLTPTSSLAPLLVTKHFNGGALQFGLLDSFWGVGMILGGVILTIWGGFKRKVKTSMMGMMGIGAGIILVGIAPSSAFYLALGGMFIVGMMVPFANGPLLAIMQSVVPPDMQGRVMSLLGSAAMAMSPLGLLVAGPVSDWMGIRTWYWISGGLTLLMGIGAFFVPAIMNLENNHEE
jgi:DHA3 family macrolide efflux protein-like MFS transporter